MLAVLAACTPELTIDLACSRDEDCRPGFGCVQSRCVDPVAARLVGPFPCQDVTTSTVFEMLQSTAAELPESLKRAKMYVCPKGYAVTGVYRRTFDPEPNVEMKLRCVRLVAPEDVDKLEIDHSFTDRQGVRVCPEGSVVVGGEYYLPALQCARLSGGRQFPFEGGEQQFWNRHGTADTKCGGGMDCCPPGSVMTGWWPYSSDLFCRRLTSWNVEAPVCAGVQL